MRHALGTEDEGRRAPSPVFRPPSNMTNLYCGSVLIRFRTRKRLPIHQWAAVRGEREMAEDVPAQFNALMMTAAVISVLRCYS